MFLLIVERKKEDHLAAASPKSDETLDQAAAIKAAFFRFLRLASRPINPKPAPKNGAATGKGDSAIMILIFKLDKVIVHRAPVPRSDPAHGDFPSRARGR